MTRRKTSRLLSDSSLENRLIKFNRVVSFSDLKSIPIDIPWRSMVVRIWCHLDFKNNEPSILLSLCQSAERRSFPTNPFGLFRSVSSDDLCQIREYVTKLPPSQSVTHWYYRSSRSLLSTIASLVLTQSQSRTRNERQIIVSSRISRRDDRMNRLRSSSTHLDSLSTEIETRSNVSDIQWLPLAHSISPGDVASAWRCRQSNARTFPGLLRGWLIVVFEEWDDTQRQSRASSHARSKSADPGKGNRREDRRFQLPHSRLL